MFRQMLRSKIHRATVTDACLEYEGSLTVDESLLEAAGILPYEAVRNSPSPETALTDFLQSTYEAGANLAKWDRKALERQEAIRSP